MSSDICLTTDMDVIDLPLLYPTLEISFQLVRLLGTYLLLRIADILGSAVCHSTETQDWSSSLQ